MSEQTKPKEFWIAEEYENAPFAYDNKADAISNAWMQSEENIIHVIEKSAFEAQALEIEKLKSGLEEMKRNWYQSNKERAQFEAELEAVKAEKSVDLEAMAKMSQEIDELQNELEKIKDEYDDFQSSSEKEWKKRYSKPLITQLDRLAQANEILRAKVLEHKEAYSTDIFPNSEKLDDNSTRDSISARMGRHMCDCFLKYMDEALAEAAKLESESGE